MNWKKKRKITLAMDWGEEQRQSNRSKGYPRSWVKTQSKNNHILSCSHSSYYYYVKQFVFIIDCKQEYSCLSRSERRRQEYLNGLAHNHLKHLSRGCNNGSGIAGARDLASLPVSCIGKLEASTRGISPTNRCSFASHTGYGEAAMEGAHKQIGSFVVLLVVVVWILKGKQKY